ncbi:MAG: Ser/Thr protein kinase RdoA (MazF antagonist) [Dinoroseobacter sp.]|jgi:Ser/Thr protein kinase RdoA (MazF antagonist)
MPSSADLSPADIALCLRDPSLEGLGTVLDATAAAAAVGLTDMRQSYLLYKPATNCTAGLIPPDGGLNAWSAMTYPSARWSEIRQRPKWTKGKTKALFLDDAYTVFVPLALERRLPQARRLSDDAKRARLLHKIGLTGCDLTILRYKPGRRIVLRADGPEGTCAIVKLHARECDFTRAVAGATQAESLGGPAVIGTSRNYLAVATVWTRGCALVPTAEPGDFALAGAALAHHHATAEKDALSDWAETPPAKAAEAIAVLLPDFAAKAREVAGHLPALPPDAPVAIHGDFSADQVVRGQTGMTILDWDRAARGPAARDLGSALAQLDLDAIRGTPTQDASAALLEGYGAVRPLPDDAAITSHRAHALLALAVDGFRSRRSNWDAEVQTVLDQVTRLSKAGLPRIERKPISGLCDAFDLRHMQTLLGPTLKNVSLTRLKPGRRAMMRYSMTDGTVLLGKIRAKGADAHAPAIQAGLRAAGLDGTDGVGVPAMAGTFAQPALWLQKAVEGRVLSELLDTGDAKAAMHRTGRALAALHNCPPQTSRRWTHDNEFAVLAKALSSPYHADLLSVAKRRLDTLPTAPLVGLHRDFYFDQVLVGPETLWLVDLDLHARGDAAVDIGNFIAHLSELAVRRGKALDHFGPLKETFIAGYETRRISPDPARIDLLHWISLARHIGIAERFPDRRHAIGAIERACHEGLLSSSAST